MKPATAQNVRRLGLAIEAVCLLGLLQLALRPFVPRTFLGLNQYQGMMIGLGVGFVLWLTGTLTYHWPKRPRSPSD